MHVLISNLSLFYRDTVERFPGDLFLVLLLLHALNDAGSLGVYGYFRVFYNSSRKTFNDATFSPATPRLSRTHSSSYPRLGSVGIQRSFPSSEPELHNSTMPTTRRGVGRPRKGGGESQPVQAPAPVIDPALESITAATPAIHSLAIGGIVTPTGAAAQVPVLPGDVPIAPELLMQDAEAQTASAIIQTAETVQGSGVNEDEESEWEYDWDDCEVSTIRFNSQGIRSPGSSQIMK